MTPQEYQKNQNEKLLKSFHNIEKGFAYQADSEFDTLVSHLFNIQALLEHCHRQTKSEPKHEALGDAYTAVADLKDKIIEHIIGITGVNYKTITLNSVPEYTPDMNTRCAGAICVLAKQLQSYANNRGMMSIDNLAQDLYGVGAQLKYKLTLNDSDEASHGIAGEEFKKLDIDPTINQQPQPVANMEIDNVSGMDNVFLQKAFDVINKSLDI